MFESLVVALDLEQEGDRALDVVHHLSRLARVRLELVTVSSPGMPTAVDAYELGRRAEQLGPERTDWVIVHDTDVADGLVQQVARHDHAVLVMATSARLPWTVRGSTAREVLRRTDRPVLLVGPEVDWSDPPSSTTIVACVDASDSATRAVPAIVGWFETFGGGAPHLVEVVATDADGRQAQRRVDAFAELLAARDVPSEPHIIHDDDPARGLARLASRCLGPVYITTSARYSDGRLHWHSTTQQLVHDAPTPVLVVPARPRPMSVHPAATRAVGRDLAPS